jgi:predicted DNA-binding transcriptional regulator YafY
MGEAAGGKTNLRMIILTCGLEEEFERDFFGRIRHKSTKRYIKAEFTPEALQALASTAATLSSARELAAGAVGAAKDAVRKRLLASQPSSGTPET